MTTNDVSRPPLHDGMIAFIMCMNQSRKLPVHIHKMIHSHLKCPLDITLGELNMLKQQFKLRSDR